MKYKDLTGKTFGKLKVIKYSHSLPLNNPKYQGRIWKTLCCCGKTHYVSTNSLTTGNTKSCGCYRNEFLSRKAIKNNTKHSFSKKKNSVYSTWKHMRSRCKNKNNHKYHRYGGRGITICEEWQEFLPFYEWAMANGYKKGLSLDRIDNDGNYEPSNCRWATPKQQARNTSKNVHYTYNKETNLLKFFAEKYHIKYGTLIARLKSGWTIDEAIETPVKLLNNSVLMLDYDSLAEIKEYGSIKEAAKNLNVDASSIYQASRGKRNSAYGYKWKLKNEKTLKVI